MEKLILNEAQKIWNKIAKNKTPGDLQLEVEIYKKLINIFQLGDYYYMIFNPPQMVIEYTSESITPILGCQPQEFTLEYLVGNIHPDDLPYFMDFEATVSEFFVKLPPDKVMKYKPRYDYRIKKKDGAYVRILQQIVTIQSDDDGAVLRTFVVHTDISHLKKDNKMTLSFIGLEGEPSYIDVQAVKSFQPSKEIFTKREKEILLLLAKGKKSTEIGETLFIAKNTVDKHRRNMLAKTKTESTIQLIMKAVEKGWI